MILPNNSMTDSNLKNYNPDELETILETIRQEREEIREEKHTGQTPRFWKLVEEEQKVRNEFLRRGLKIPAPYLSVILEG